MTIDLNCDMGEGIGNDAAIMPYLSSANIACGYHAGDDVTMRTTVQLAVKQGVMIGAHPGYADKVNFGRHAQQLDHSEIYDLIVNQIRLLDHIAREEGATLNHVKPHGALYNAAAVSQDISNSIVSAIYDFDPNLSLYGLANSAMIQAAQARGLKFKQEVFADRTYQPNGTLTPRSQPNALIEDEQQSIAQVMQMVQTQSVTVVDGTCIPILADTICIHGDGAHAVVFAKTLFTKLRSVGIKIAAQ
jgi:UPF0271 protein